MRTPDFNMAFDEALGLYLTNRLLELTRWVSYDSFLPSLSGQWQFIEFSSRFPPSWVVLVKDRDEAIIMGWFKQVDHFMDDDVFEKILWFLYEFGVEANVAGAVVAASPLGFHSLQVITGNFYPQLCLPLLDELRNDFVQKGFVPFMNDLGTFFGVASGTHGKGDSFVVERNKWLRISVRDGQ
jgi:hypothetical protein